VSPDLEFSDRCRTHGKLATLSNGLADAVEHIGEWQTRRGKEGGNGARPLHPERLMVEINANALELGPARTEYIWRVNSGKICAR
jgi:hypothetical protein